MNDVNNFEKDVSDELHKYDIIPVLSDIIQGYTKIDFLISDDILMDTYTIFSLTGTKDNFISPEKIKIRKLEKLGDGYVFHDEEFKALIGKCSYTEAVRLAIEYSKKK